MTTKSATVLVIMAVLALYSTMSSAYTHVTATSGLKGSKDLTLHCQSKNNDLRTHVVPHGSSWGFKFRQNWFGKTLYFCRFTWARVDGKYFNMFEQHKTRCDECCWVVKETGPCGCPCHSPLCLPWN